MVAVAAKPLKSNIEATFAGTPTALSAGKWECSNFHGKCFLFFDRSASIAVLWEQQGSQRVYANFGLCRSCWLSPILLLELLVFGELAGNHISYIRIKLLCSFQVCVFLCERVILIMFS